MNRWILAAPFLLGIVGFAAADYVIIVANVGSERELRGQQAGRGVGGAPGAGFPGGLQGAPGAGFPGGLQGAPGAGIRGGVPGLPGGLPGGKRGMGGVPAMTGAADIDDVPYFILAVVEVKPYLNNGDVLKQFQKGEKLGLSPSLAKVKLTDRLGEEYDKTNKPVYLLSHPSFGELHVLTESGGKSLPTVQQQFDKKLENLTLKGKPSAESLLQLAEWTLSHGLIDKFPTVMDKLVEADKGHRAAVAYLKVKSAIDQPPARDEGAIAQLKKALGGYKDVPGQYHYVLLYDRATALADVKAHLSQLENSFRGFYYWFALKGVALPTPSRRQVVVLTGSEKDFDSYHKALASGPVVVDGFYARRENLAVMSSKRLDESYDALSKYYQSWEDKGFRRADILLKPPKTDLQSVAEAQMLALMLKSMEKEAELATVSHDASRQLLFASGLLPNNVAAPEWLLFGMGSFFETPLQSPWPSLGAPNSYYLPHWTELKGKGLEKTRGDTLRRVVTDAYFRGLPTEGKAGSDERHVHDAALRKARATAWSLAYFLATSERRFEGLLAYFKELSKMPRDIELDDEILLGCFARAFGLVDASNKLDNAKLVSLEREWFSHMDNVHFESEATVKKIRQTLRDKLKEMQEAAEATHDQVPIDPRTGQPMQPGAFPPNGFPQQGPRPGGLPQQGPRPGGFRPQPQPQPQPQQPQPGRVPGRKR
jgi:hypothetical protein